MARCVVVGDQKSQSVPWWKIAGGLASIATLLAFVGVPSLGALQHALFPSAPPTTSATAPPTYTTDPAWITTYSPDPSTTTSSTDTPTTTSSTDPPTTTTDQNPLTAAGLLPQGFTDDLRVHYSRLGWGTHSCVIGAMSADVQATLETNGCTVELWGGYLSDDTKILTSVQIFPFDSAATAQQVYSSFAPGGTWRFGIWCPGTGPGSYPCTNGYGAAHSSEYIRSDNRYLIEAKAIYTDQTTGSWFEPWATSAAQTAVDVCGP
jgi:hypothetical protein